MAFFPLYFIMDSGYTNEVSVYKLYLLGATPPESLSLWERWHCGAMTERASPAGQSCHAAISRPFVRAILSLCLRFLVSGLALSGATRQGRVAAPSVCFAVACILLAAAPTAPPCFRRWRRSSPLPPKGEPLACRATFRWTPKARQDAKGRASLTGAAASGQEHLVKLS